MSDHEGITSLPKRMARQARVPMALGPGSLPADHVTELMKLQSQAPPMGRRFVRRRMTGESGECWRDHLLRSTRMLLLQRRLAKFIVQSVSMAVRWLASCNIQS